MKTENIISRYRDAKEVISLGDRSHTVQDIDAFRYFGDINFPPKVFNSLPDFNVSIGGTLDIDISDIFTDTDLDRDRTIDVLSLTALSANDTVVIAKVIGTTLKLFGTGGGITNVTVFAKDLYGEVISDTFDILVTTIVWMSGSILAGPSGGDRNIYEVEVPTGIVLRKFTVNDVVSPGIASISGLIYDETDDTLWFNDNQDFNPNNGLGGQRLIHMRMDKSVISEQPSNVLGMNHWNGFDIDKRDDTWWIASAFLDRVYHVNKTLTSLISSFSLGGAISGLTFQRNDNTLWITDHGAAFRIMRKMSLSGVVLDSFLFSAIDDPAGPVLFITAVAWDSVSNSLWLNGPSRRKIWNTDFAGNVISVFESNDVDSDLQIFGMDNASS